jgi:hypothetical protein
MFPSKSTDLLENVTMRDEQLLEEDTYFAIREEQLVRRLGRSGHTRREILKRGAAGALLLAGAGRLPGVGTARAATPAPTTPIVKPLPPEWFINYGTNAEMRWDAVPGLGYFIPNERFFIRDHTSTPLIDASTWKLSSGATGCAAAPASQRRSRSATDSCARCPRWRSPPSSSVRATVAASSQANRARRRAGRSGDWARSG